MTTATGTQAGPGQQTDTGATGPGGGRDEALPPVAAERLAAVLGPGSAARPSPPGALSASLAFGWRTMLKIKHVPEQLFDVTAFPIMMTLMFTYLFGGALAGSTERYLQFLLPGIMVMSVVMTTMYTGVAVNTDIAKGVFDRFRTLPVWRPAAMVGYLLGDLLRYVLAATTIMAVGLVMGFRPGGGVTGVLAGVGLLVAFSFAFSWLWTMFGLLLRSEKSVMGVSMMVLFPLTFLSNVFVSPATMPGWLRAVVDHSPITHLVAAIRSLMAGAADGGEIGWVAIWGAAFILVCAPLTMRLYNRK
ncbi:ABC transporter permease [Streptomyces sp. URMC 123]|uniref:ABC transporter permease n=1 Tax=Streptomyces sp. URMC 123 TaxID=3423403 RepID=UPI003F1B37B4